MFQCFGVKQRFSETVRYSHTFCLVNTLWCFGSGPWIYYLIFSIDAFFQTKPRVFHYFRRWKRVSPTDHQTVIFSPPTQGNLLPSVFVRSRFCWPASIVRALKNPTPRVIKSYNFDKLETTELLKTKPKIFNYEPKQPGLEKKFIYFIYFVRELWCSIQKYIM